MMSITLEIVNENQKHILGNLLEFYVYEFSSYLAIDFNEVGLYGFELLESYFFADFYFPYFIKFSNKLVGFAIVKEDQQHHVFSIDQFFIAKKYAGNGIGKKAAKMVFDLHKGKWKVTQIEKNYAAQAFWRNTIHEYTNGACIESYDEKRRSVQAFENELE